MKKFDIILGTILGIIFISFLIWMMYGKNNTQVKLYEGLDAEKIERICIFNPGNNVKTNDKKEISEIVNELKKFTFYKKPDLIAPNKDPDYWITLIDNEGLANYLVIYGGVGIYNKEKDYYELGPNTSKAFDDLCKKYSH